MKTQPVSRDPIVTASVALRDIRKLPFHRLVRDIVQDFKANEAYLYHVMPKDFQLARAPAVSVVNALKSDLT